MPRLLDRLAEKVGQGATAWLILRELRQLRRSLEIGIDSYRLTHGLGAMFETAPVSDDAIEETVEGRDEPDWLRLSLIEALCEEHRVPYDDRTDLLQLAIEHGWMTPEGQLVSLPASVPGTY